MTCTCPTCHQPLDDAADLAALDAARAVLSRARFEAFAFIYANPGISSETLGRCLNKKSRKPAVLAHVTVCNANRLLSEAGTGLRIVSKLGLAADGYRVERVAS